MFFFRRKRNHRDLHSFPTRRSSDLPITPPTPQNRADDQRLITCRAKAGTAKTARSEEHTSELQSHSDLVCRLLLEKKNKSRHLARKLSLRNKMSSPNVVEMAATATI